MKILSGNSEYIIETCCACNMEFGMTKVFYEKRLADKKNFFCPSGHSQYYVGETEEKRLERELQAERERANRLSVLLQKKNKKVKK